MRDHVWIMQRNHGKGELAMYSCGRSALALAAAFFVCAVLVRCSSDTTAPVESRTNTGVSPDARRTKANQYSRHVSAVIITPANATIPVGDTLRFSAAFTTAGGGTITGPTGRWASSDPAMARVDRSGLVTAVATGPVSITATAEGVTGTAHVMVVSLDDDFAMNCDPSIIRLERSSAGTLACTVRALSAFNGPVVLDASHLPAGVTIAPFDTKSVPLSGGQTATVFLHAEIGPTIATGEYRVHINGTGGGITRTAVVPLAVSAAGAQVHMIYLLPSDVAYDPLVALGMDRAIRHLQTWYQEQLSNGRTFAIHDPVITVLHSTHPASYFATSSFSRAAADVFEATGSFFNDSTAIWDIYLPVVTDGQGGTSSVALLGENDVLGISGEDTQGFTIARWIGGLGHEMGHAFGLAHPPACDAGQMIPDCSSIMFLGYLDYPDTFLSEADKTQLDAGPFVTSSVAVTSMQFDADKLTPAPQP
jgi:hypothetical protein